MYSNCEYTSQSYRCPPTTCYEMNECNTNCCSLQRRNYSMCHCPPQRSTLPDFNKVPDYVERRKLLPVQSKTDAKNESNHRLKKSGKVTGHNGLGKTSDQSDVASKKNQPKQQLPRQRSLQQIAHTQQSPPQSQQSRHLENLSHSPSQTLNSPSSSILLQSKIFAAASSSSMNNNQKYHQPRHTRTSPHSSPQTLNSSNSFNSTESFATSSSKKNDQKYVKNKQNFQYHDTKRMEVINEEQENEADSEEGYFNDDQHKNIQDSCADFLNIVHDTVLESVQKSVESILREYFVHTMEKIECLSSQMLRNECLLSKMYLDIVDKFSQQSEHNLQQFKCICYCLNELKGNNCDQPNQRCCCRTTDEDDEDLIECKCYGRVPTTVHHCKRSKDYTDNEPTAKRQYGVADSDGHEPKISPNTSNASTYSVSDDTQHLGARVKRKVRYYNNVKSGPSVPDLSLNSKTKL